MNTTEIILVFYVLPMVISGVCLFLDEDTKTMGDWLDDCGYVLVPIVNIVLTFLLIILGLITGLKLRQRWKNFRNLKIRD